MKKTIIIILVVLVCGIGICIYSGYKDTTKLKTNEIKIEVNNLSDSYDGLKIVHISDLYYGTSIKDDELNNIVDEINRLKPDIVAFTGDLLDTNISLSVEDYDALEKALKSINATLGKFIITGENDTDSKWESIVTNGGFTNLNNNYQLLYSNNTTPIIISGVSSNLNSSVSIVDKIKPIDNYISSLSTKPAYSILLIHEPDYIDDISTGNYNLILAGHNLGGQIKLPFIGPIIASNGAKKYNNSYYKINDSDMYVSNGLGTSKINNRFMNIPSINFFRITKK